MSNNNENSSNTKHFEFGEKRFSSNSWKKYENEQTKQLFKNYLNINDFFDIDKDAFQNITNQQETNVKMNNLFSVGTVAALVPNLYAYFQFQFPTDLSRVGRWLIFVTPDDSIVLKFQFNFQIMII